MDAKTGTIGHRSPASVGGQIATTASIAIVVYAAMDMCHEVLGHGMATLFVDDVTPVSLTTVALSSSGAVSRWVALAGPLTNLVLGIFSLAWFRRLSTFGTGSFFLWLFAVVNLLNGTGYAIYSGGLDFGDLAVVIAGWEPHLAWRVGMLVLGVAGYYLSLRVSSISLARRLDDCGVARRVVPRLVWSAYLAGGLLLVAGAAMNPFSSLILLSGVSGGFVCMAGILFVPQVADPTPVVATGDVPWRVSWLWIVSAVVVAAVFVFIIGPGISLHA
jgi:hypothetical protein